MTDATNYSHPAGRGWIPRERDIGLPGESAGADEAQFAAGENPPLHSTPASAGAGIGDRGVVADAAASVADRGHHPQTPSSQEEGAYRHHAQEQFTPSREARVGAEAAAPGGRLAFTPTRQVRFCDDLAGHGNVRLACAREGIAAQTAYRFKRRDPAFARCWDAALGLAREHAGAVLAERALEGVEEAVFYHGEEIARRRRYDSRLLLAHIARLDAQHAAIRAARDDYDEPEVFDDLLLQLADPGREPLGSREAFVDEWVAEAEYAAIDALHGAGEAGDEAGDEGGADADWDGEAPDPVAEAADEARWEAAERWEQARAENFALVDAVVAGAGELVTPENPPVEVKGGETPSPLRPGPPAARQASLPSREREGLGEGLPDREISSPLNPVTCVTSSPCPPIGSGFARPCGSLLEGEKAPSSLEEGVGGWWNEQATDAGASATTPRSPPLKRRGSALLVTKSRLHAGTRTLDCGQNQSGRV